jgi:hypothetical protein
VSPFPDTTAGGSGGSPVSAGDVLGFGEGLRELVRYNNMHASDARNLVRFANAADKYAFGISVGVALPVFAPLLANSPQFISSTSYAAYTTYMNYAPEINSFVNNVIEGALPSATSNVPQNIPEAIGSLVSPDSGSTPIFSPGP